MSRAGKAEKIRERIKANRERNAVQYSKAQQFAEEKGWAVIAPFSIERLFAREGTTRDQRQPTGLIFDYFSDRNRPVAVVIHGNDRDMLVARKYATRHSLEARDVFPSWYPERVDYGVILQRSAWTFGRIN